MGIPSYFSYILKKFPNVIKEQKYLNEIHNFFLDSNSIIYDIVNHLTNYKVSNINDIIINKVIEKINHYIDIINPRGITMIAFDGVAPVANCPQEPAGQFDVIFVMVTP
jgi:5'-3' exonuclease